MDDFKAMVEARLLPEFCDAPSRQWDKRGFKAEWARITSLDAKDFLRAMDGALVEHVGGGMYRAPRSFATEQFFWSGRKAVSPRPITLWAEPIITVAVLARLHFDLGWPMAQLGAQSKGWAFDAAAYVSEESENEHIAVEIKKSVAELEYLLQVMCSFGQNADAELPASRKEANGYRKLQALKERRAPFFWAVGPGGVNKAFRLKYSGDGSVAFHLVSADVLACPG